ncbi:MIP/aquaporin family protein [Bifidobacterium cuniculi]|uniref:Membrane channel protein n=1 Tax=Bifidobacterium cuniculi TaxID=1688 RepID=A0A087AW15_9BIFI|nr:aquaporin [Bifidobacterium cuniculi]KFI62965.1 membrane channel protein [Bifidobacterium cuniculi]
MTAVETNATPSTKPAHGLWARLGAEFVGSLFICFAIYIMSTFGTLFFSVNLAYLALGAGVVYAAVTAIFGKISGGQFNPAVTVAAMLTSKTKVLEGFGYIVAQVLGAICAGGLLSFMLPTADAVPSSQWYMLAVNGFDQGSLSYMYLNQYGMTYGIAMAIIIELIASAIVVAAALQSMKGDGSPTRSHTVTMGLAYAAATAMAFPVTNGAVNPIRATGIAIFAQGKGLEVEPLAQLWVFWVSSILAAALVALVIIVAQLLASNKDEGETSDVAEAAMLEDGMDGRDVPDGNETLMAVEYSDGSSHSVVEQEDADVEHQE